MRAIVLTGPGRITLEECHLPKPRRDEVRVRTRGCGICATDLDIIRSGARVKCPAVLGHEWCGVVDAVGDGVDRGWMGTVCVGQNVLSDGGEIGFEHPGGYGEYFVTEAAKLQRLPDHFPVPMATLIEPLAVSLRGVRRLAPHDLSAALVFGDGPIGLVTTMLLKHKGVQEVSLVGGREKRLALARDMGADRVLNYHEAGNDLVAGVRRLWAGGFPNVVEATGKAAALEAALELLASQGKVLVLGNYGEQRARFVWNHLLLREIELIGSNASAGPWDQAVGLAVERAPLLERLVTHRFPATRFTEALETARASREAIKVVLEWD